MYVSHGYSRSYQVYRGPASSSVVIKLPVTSFDHVNDPEEKIRDGDLFVRPV